MTSEGGQRVCACRSQNEDRLDVLPQRPPESLPHERRWAEMGAVGLPAVAPDADVRFPIRRRQLVQRQQQRGAAAVAVHRVGVPL